MTWPEFKRLVDAVYERSGIPLEAELDAIDWSSANDEECVDVARYPDGTIRIWNEEET